MPYILAIYEMDRQYGGPEEGGWYYDCGVFERLIVRRFPRAEEAYAAANRCNTLLDKLQKSKRPVGSVIYGGGRHTVRVCEGLPEPYYPRERPYYE